MALLRANEIVKKKLFNSLPIALERSKLTSYKTLECGFARLFAGTVSVSWLRTGAWGLQPFRSNCSLQWEGKEDGWYPDECPP